MLVAGHDVPNQPFPQKFSRLEVHLQSVFVFLQRFESCGKCAVLLGVRLKSRVIKQAHDDLFDGEVDTNIIYPANPESASPNPPD